MGKGKRKERKQEGKLQIEGDRLPRPESESETAVAAENICSIERQIKSFYSLARKSRSLAPFIPFCLCPTRGALSPSLISTISLQSSRRKSLPRSLKPLPRRGSTSAAAADQQHFPLRPAAAPPLEKSSKAENNRCAIKVLFDSGQAPLLLDLVSYDTVKTLRGVLKYEVRRLNKFSL